MSSEDFERRIVRSPEDSSPELQRIVEDIAARYAASATQKRIAEREMAQALTRAASATRGVGVAPAMILRPLVARVTAILRESKSAREAGIHDPEIKAIANHLMIEAGSKLK